MDDLVFSVGTAAIEAQGGPAGISACPRRYRQRWPQQRHVGHGNPKPCEFAEFADRDGRGPLRRRNYRNSGSCAAGGCGRTRRRRSSPRWAMRKLPHQPLSMLRPSLAAGDAGFPVSPPSRCRGLLRIWRRPFGDDEPAGGHRVAVASPARARARPPVSRRQRCRGCAKMRTTRRARLADSRPTSR